MLASWHQKFQKNASKPERFKKERGGWAPPRTPMRKLNVRIMGFESMLKELARLKIKRGGSGGCEHNARSMGFEKMRML